MSGIHKLYGRPGSGSAVCEALLILTGLPHELVDFGTWHRTAPPPELVAVSPLAQVPVLVLPDGQTMTESAAIALHLADLMPQAELAPGLSDPLRPKYLRWMLYLATQNYPTALRFYYPERYTDELAGADSVKNSAQSRSAIEWSIFTDALGEGPFMLGSKMSALDLYATMLASWDVEPKSLLARHHNLQRLCHAVARVPVLKDVSKRHWACFTAAN